jgi:hypothetical protein
MHLQAGAREQTHIVTTFEAKHGAPAQSLGIYGRLEWLLEAQIPDLKECSIYTVRLGLKES